MASLLPSNSPSTANPTNELTMRKEGSKSVLKEQHQTGDQGQGDGKPKPHGKGFAKPRKGKPGKIHIRLPPIEAYEKDLCFAAEAPGRVVVRLERLMGSDKIRPVDGKFMETLLLRLEEEEKIAWERKIKLRKKAEKDRHRQLAIQGLMEPGPGMEDLYDHPVFRVNRILNRLSSLDHTFSHLTLKLPPIDKIDPFEQDGSGASFKEYPFHRMLRKEWEKCKARHPEKVKVEEVGPDAKNLQDFVSKTTNLVPTESSKEKLSSTASKSSAASKTKSKSISKPSSQLLQDEGTVKSKASTVPRSKRARKPKAEPSRPLDIEEEDEYDEELEEGDLDLAQSPSNSEMEAETAEPLPEPTQSTPSKIEQLSADVNRELQASLEALQKKYSVPNYEGFEEDWKPYRNELVDKLYTDFEGMDEMYEGAREIFELYTKQEIAAQNHVKGVAAKAAKSKMQEEKSKTTAKSQEAAAPLTDEEELMNDEEWGGESASRTYTVASNLGDRNVQDEEMDLEELSASEEEDPTSVRGGEMETLSSRQLGEDALSSSAAENTEDEEEEEVSNEVPDLTQAETDVEEEEEAEE